MLFCCVANGINKNKNVTTLHWKLPLFVTVIYIKKLPGINLKDSCFLGLETVTWVILKTQLQKSLISGEMGKTDRIWHHFVSFRLLDYFGRNYANSLLYGCFKNNKIKVKRWKIGTQECEKCDKVPYNYWDVKK